MDLMWTDGFDGPRDGEFDDFHRVLTPEIVPSPDAPFWMDIAEFALSFDGYSALGGFDELATLAHATAKRWRRTKELPESLVELRSCLFFEHRSYRHTDTTPEGTHLDYIRALVEAIRVHAAGK